jgi:putative DNA primase/helicase
VNWANYDDVRTQFLLAGLQVEDLEIGRLRRCKIEGDREKRGWYNLHELRLDDGNLVLVGAFGVWRGAESNSQKIDLAAWLKGQKRAPMTDEQRAAIKARVQEDLKAAERIRKGAAAKAALRAQHAWSMMLREGDSPYLKRKGIQAHGVRFSRNGKEVIVPMLDTSGRIHGLQRIYPDKSKGRDKDFWPAGLAKQGHFFQMGPQPTSVLLVVEGYATGASVFEASGWPTFVAWDAGNLQPVVHSLAKRYKGVRILVCADDDYLTEGNPGVSKASAAALAVDGAWVAPVFAADRAGKKITDFNDLHLAEGLHQVRAQIEAKLRQLGWDNASQAAPRQPQGEGGGNAGELMHVNTVEEIFERYTLVYEMPDVVFDCFENKLVPIAGARNISNRFMFKTWIESPTKHLVRQREVGFDPSEQDAGIKCNLWGGWPTQPKEGDCDILRELLWHLCSGEPNTQEVYDWVLKWLAYPIQHPGAKMKTALVFHGPQGVGKNIFFEAVMAIYGEYGRIIDQAAVEDKFNDWSSRKLFLIADEVVARSELWQTKNKLKGIITGEWIRINPKNMGAYDERNHVNMVFLSNETKPVVLEEDDRRYAVVWTPAKLDPAFYETVRLEIEAGGIEALHHFLKTLPLGDFKPWTGPPITESKRALVEASRDSSAVFWREFIDRRLPLPLTPFRGEDFFEAYRYWCQKVNCKAPSLNTFVCETAKRPGVARVRKRHYTGSGVAVQQSTILFPPGTDQTLEIRELSDELDKFKDAVRAWKSADAGYSGGAA